MGTRILVWRKPSFWNVVVDGRYVKKWAYLCMQSTGLYIHHHTSSLLACGSDLQARALFGVLAEDFGMFWQTCERRELQRYHYQECPNTHAYYKTK